MREARFVRFVKGRYWVTLTKTAEHPYKVFQDRHEAKVWLLQYGVLRSVAENCLLEADAGVSARVLLSSLESVHSVFLFFAQRLGRIDSCDP
jgi:hypothetical protein